MGRQSRCVGRREGGGVSIYNLAVGLGPIPEKDRPLVAAMLIIGTIGGTVAVVCTLIKERRDRQKAKEAAKTHRDFDL